MPDPTADAEIVPLDDNIFGAGQPCFGCSPTHPIGLRLKFGRQGDTIVTRFVPEENHQGPPGLLHGGLVTTLADELAAWTIIGLKERLGFTASIEARLRRPLRIAVEVQGRGRILEDRKRILKVGVTLSQEDELAFEGTFTFALLDRSGAERLLGGPLPEVWQRFCR